MTLVLEETPESRQWSANPHTYQLVYKATGEFDDAIVQQYALDNTPLTATTPMGTVNRLDVRVEPDGWGQHVVTVPFGPAELGSVPVLTHTFSFDTTGATFKLKSARAHVATYPTDGDPHKGSIGVQEDGEVEGADVIIPGLLLNYTFKHPAGVVTEAKARQLAAATGKTNSDTFRGFAPGELLFVGATGSDGNDSEAEVAYQFVASSNESGLTIGDISDIAKQGHQYLWIEFEDDVDDGDGIRKPKRVHIEDVYDAVNFSETFGWS